MIVRRERAKNQSPECAKIETIPKKIRIIQEGDGIVQRIEDYKDYRDYRSITSAEQGAWTSSGGVSTRTSRWIFVSPIRMQIPQSLC